MDSLVSTDWLAARIGSGDLAILDASSHLPAAGRDARAEFAAGHVPGARFLDLATLFDAASPVPAALPTAAQLAERLAALGVPEQARIVLYDDSEVRTAARAWFILRHHGFDQVAILDGGLGKWRAEGRPLERGTDKGASPGSAPGPRPVPAPFAMQVRSKADMLANINTGAEQVLDARDEGRFSGRLPDFRPGIPSGHIPGSRNLPFGEMLNANGTYKEPAELRRAFADAGIDMARPIVTTCGSGVTAAVLLFALHLLGKDDAALYDGSWSEWAADPATPKAPEPA